MAIDWQARLQAKLLEPSAIVEEPAQAPVGAEALAGFFNSTETNHPGIPDSSGKPPLPEELLLYHWLYRQAIVEEDAELLELIEDTAAVLRGERSGKIWQELKEANLAEMIRRDGLRITDAILDLSGDDPFIGEETEVWIF